MALQSLLVYSLVAGCFVYAAWTLMPQVARRLTANGLLRLPLPDAWRTALQKTLSTSGGCHCSGCDHALPKAGAVKAPAPQVLVFHPRKRP